MSRNFKLTEESIVSYMQTKLPGMVITGETSDSFVIQSGRTKSVRSVSKQEFENYAISNNFVDNGIKPKENVNFGQAASKEYGKAKANHHSEVQLIDQFRKDPVYSAAIKNMTPEQQNTYLEKFNSAEPMAKLEMATALRDNYADSKYNHNQHQGSYAQALETIEREKNAPASNPAKGNKSYARNPDGSRKAGVNN